MASAINMPQVGQDIESARILEWFVQEGDEVQVGDILATVESDKANFEVEAFESGIVLKLLYQAGQEAGVFQPIAYVGQKGESIPDKMPEAAVQTGREKSSTSYTDEEIRSTGEKSGRLVASPSARRVARNSGLSLESIPGSGPDGRIIKADVEHVLSLQRSGVRITPLAQRITRDIGVSPSELQGSGPRGKIRKQDILQQLGPRRSPVLQAETGDQVVEFDRTRKRIAERLVLSTQTIPHFYLFMEVEMDVALAWRKTVNKSTTEKISVNDLLVKASVEALKEYPRLNSHVDDEKILIKPDIHLGIAVATEKGLLVPLIPDAGKLSMEQISSTSRKIAEDARRGVIRGDQVGTFTISNLGMMGIDRFLPIINPPESAILSVGQVEKKVVPDGTTYRICDKMTLGLACDHRAVDGEEAARFLHCLKQKLEHFDKEMQL